MKKCMSTNIIITNTMKMNAIAAAGIITTMTRMRSTSIIITLSLIHI